MTQHLGRGLWGGVALSLAACGGTADFRTQVEDDGGSGGSSSNQVASGGAGTTEPIAGTAGTSLPGPLGGRGTEVPVAGTLPSEGTLAHDADGDGLGRSIFLTSFEREGCVQRLTDPSQQAKQAAFSADGRLLAYAAQVDGIYQIHVRDLTTGTVEQVTEQPVGATSPAFSPDGSLVAFVTGDPEVRANRAPGEGSLMLVDLDTLEATLVSDAESLGCCTQQYLSPTFNGSDEIVVGTRTSLLAWVSLHPLRGWSETQAEE